MTRRTFTSTDSGSLIGTTTADEHDVVGDHDPVLAPGQRRVEQAERAHDPFDVVRRRPPPGAARARRPGTGARSAAPSPRTGCRASAARRDRGSTAVNALAATSEAALAPATSSATSSVIADGYQAHQGTRRFRPYRDPSGGRTSARRHGRCRGRWPSRGRAASARSTTVIGVIHRWPAGLRRLAEGASLVVVVEDDDRDEQRHQDRDSTSRAGLASRSS